MTRTYAHAMPLVFAVLTACGGGASGDHKGGEESVCGDGGCGEDAGAAPAAEVSCVLPDGTEVPGRAPIGGADFGACPSGTPPPDGNDPPPAPVPEDGGVGCTGGVCADGGDAEGADDGGNGDQAADASNDGGADSGPTGPPVPDGGAALVPDAGGPLPCPPAGPCARYVRDPATGECLIDTKPDGTKCDDGDACTNGGQCAAGSCTGEAKACPEPENPCLRAACDPASGICGAVPAPDGLACDDGRACTGSDLCEKGKCTGIAKDCSFLEDNCHFAKCVEPSGACEAIALADGTICNDGSPCSEGDICFGGKCLGQPKVCPGSPNPCEAGVCDPATGACGLGNAPNGTPCDDGTFCGVDGACTAGNCVTKPRDCSAAGGQCKVGVCDEILRACKADPEPTGAACDDGKFCTVNDTCADGACKGTARDCATGVAVCKLGVCDENADTCKVIDLAAGTPCDDGLFCTQNDFCSGGVCNGSVRDCAGTADACNNGICSEVAKACVKQPKPNGTTCNDAKFCTVNDSCVNGVCGGSPAPCSGPCLTGVCDEGSGICVAVTNGTACPGGTCQGGACQ